MKAAELKICRYWKIASDGEMSICKLDDPNNIEKFIGCCSEADRINDCENRTLSSKLLPKGF